MTGVAATRAPGEEESAGDRNIHLPYHQRVQVHHRVVASLADAHTARGRVLDVGCGLGYTLSELRRLRPDLQLHGADADEGCLRRTCERIPEIRAIRMAEDRFDVESLGSGYDTCILSHVLEHLPRPKETVELLLGLLRPGGHLILAVPNPVCPVNILGTLRRKPLVNPGHLQTWDRAHWMNFLENWIDAEVVEYASDEVRILPSRLKHSFRFIERIHVALAKILPWWSFSNIAVLRRPEDAG